LRKIMTDNQTHNSMTSEQSKLVYLYYYALSSLCREERLRRDREALLWDMHEIANQLPLSASVTDTEVTVGFPVRHFLNKRMNPSWYSLQCNLNEVRSMLFVCSLRIVSGENYGRKHSRQVNLQLRSVRERLSDIASLPCVQTLFRTVSQKFGAANV
jgi:hypothetical protein